MLVNAIYFKAPWEHAFVERATSKRFFFADGTERIKISFMTHTKKHGYAKLADFDAQLLELDYQVKFLSCKLLITKITIIDVAKGGDFSFVVVLPNKKDGLAQLEKKLLTSSLSELLQRVSIKTLELYLPKFKIETTLDLKKPLCKVKQCLDFIN